MGVAATSNGSLASDKTMRARSPIYPSAQCAPLHSMPRPLSRPPWPRASPSCQPRGVVPWPIAGALRPMPAHSANCRRTALRACVPNTKRASLVLPDVVGVGVPARGLAAMGIVRREELIGCREMYDSWGGACMIIGMAPAWWLGRRRHVRGRMGNWCGAVTIILPQRDRPRSPVLPELLAVGWPVVLVKNPKGKKSNAVCSLPR